MVPVLFAIIHLYENFVMEIVMLIKAI